MRFKKLFLEKEFKNYYKRTGSVATHIFVHSIEQEEISKSCDLDKIQTRVEGVVYSEMRGRDADLHFNWEDTSFVSVGRYEDVKLSR